MKINPKISIVTVSYNTIAIIEETILSIINQTYTNIEYMIIDGGSTDGTINIINKYSNKISYWISENDKGIYDAMNKAINIASGEWIIFINAGDKLYSNTIISDIFSNSQNYADVYYGDHIIESFHKQIVKIGNNPFYYKSSGYRSMGFSHQTVFVKTELARNELFDLSFKCCADYKMIYNLYKNGNTFCYIPKIISIIKGGEGFSEQHRSLQMLEEAKICNAEKSLYFRLLFKYRAFKRFIHRIINH